MATGLKNNMKTYILIILTLSNILNLNAQKKEQLSIQISYGLIGNNSVRSYSENARPSVNSFYKKNFVGTISGIEARYNVGKNGNLGLGFFKSINKKVINYDNGRNISVRDFTIGHTNYYYLFDYENWLLKKKNNVALHLGIYYLRSKMQEIDVTPEGVVVDERKFKNSKIEDGGALIGVHYFRKIDTKFDFGIKARATFSLAIGIMDAITLTPTLRYHF